MNIFYEFEKINKLYSTFNLDHLSRNGVSNEFLQRIINCMDFSPEIEFHGVKIINEWDSAKMSGSLKTCFCIVNVYGHFVSIIKTKNYVLYLDPVGFAPIFKKLREKLKDFKSPIFFNIYNFQNSSSNYCGLYCLFFLVFILLKSCKCGIEFEFRQNSLENDEIVSNVLLEYFSHSCVSTTHERKLSPISY